MEKGTGASRTPRFRLPEGLLIGRDPEIEALGAQLERASQGGTPVACITGRSGAGKTALISSFIASADVPLHGFGKYDQVSSLPHAGIAGALGQIVDTMLGKPDDVLDVWAAELTDGLGAGAGELLTLVPELSVVLTDARRGVGADGGSALTRLTQAVGTLLAVTARIAGPVVVVLDDLQWAEATDIDMVTAIIAGSPPGVLLACVWRSASPEVADRVATAAAGDTLRIDMQPLSARDIERWLSEITSTAVPSDIVSLFEQRTRGNPLYLEQLLRTAAAADAVSYDLASGQWHWDIEWLRNRPVSEGLADLFAASLDELPPEHRRVLAMTGCIGAPFTLTEAATAADVGKEEVAEALWSGLEAGYLIADGAGPHDVLDATRRYRFSHDRIAEAVVAPIDEPTQGEIHLRLGRSLRDAQDGQRIFEAVTHLALARNLIADEHERRDACGLALAAGDAARAQASFSLATEYFRFGLDLGQGLELDPDTIARLRFGAVEGAWLTGDTQLEAQLAEAWDAAHTPTERAALAFLRMKIDLARHADRRALDLGIETLADLGTPLPSSVSRGRLGLGLARTALSLRRLSDRELLDLPPATDATAVAAGPIIAELFSTSYATDQELFPFVVLKAVDLTLDAGRMPISPVAFAGYGLLQVVLGRYDTALRFGDLAMQMVDAEDSVEFRPWVHFLFYNFIHHWRRPIREGLGAVQDAQEEAIQRGDLEYAGYLAAAELAQRFNLGTPFELLNERGAALVATFPTETKQVEICESVRQLIHNLNDLSPDPAVLAGSTSYDEMAIVPVAEQQNDLVTLAVHASVRLTLAYWSGDQRTMIEAAERMDRYLDGLAGTAVIPAVHLVLGIVGARSNTGERRHRRWVTRSLKLLGNWAEGAPENYTAHAELLRGEVARARNDLSAAERHLDEAIRAADAHNIPLIGAMAKEVAAELYAETGRTAAARGLMEDAVRAMEYLGLDLRLNQLRRSGRLGEADIEGSDDVTRPSGTGSASSDLEVLVTELLRSAISTTGATRALLVLDRDGRLEIQAEASATGTIFKEVAEPAADGQAYAASILRYVSRTGEPVIVSEAKPTHADAYVASGVIRSLLALPITGRRRRVGILHLESGDQPGLFDQQTAEDLLQRAEAVATAFEHSILERELELSVRRSSTLQEAHARIIPGEFLRALGAEDLGAIRSGQTVEREWSSLFSDLRGYTSLTEGMAPDAVGKLITGFLRAVEPPIVANDGFVHDTKGDEVLALFGGGPTDAVRAALGMQRAQRAHNEARKARGEPLVKWGIGINHGPVFLGMVEGVNHAKATVLGDSLNLASRIESYTRRYDSDLLVSQHVVAAIDASAFKIRRAEKVIPWEGSEPVIVYEIYDHDAEDLIEAKDAATDVFAEAFDAYDSGDFAAAIAAFEHCLTAVPNDGVARLHLRMAREHAQAGSPPDWSGATRIVSK